eukprot:6195757-Pleurochrysis_carterae.AAC.2
MAHHNYGFYKSRIGKDEPTSIDGFKTGKHYTLIEYISPISEYTLQVVLECRYQPNLACDRSCYHVQLKPEAKYI